MITEENFDEYFFDVRRFSPKKGQVMACYTSMAEFIEGEDKVKIVDMLCKTNNAKSALTFMTKILFAVHHDALKVLINIIKDLMRGMTTAEVIAKPYPYKLQIYFYTQKEHVPTDDPHWSIIDLLNIDSFVDNQNRLVSIKSNVEFPDELSIQEPDKDSDQ